jgi:hypothetical protein
MDGGSYEAARPSNQAIHLAAGNGPPRGFFANDDPSGEARGVAIYVFLPIAVGFLLSRLVIHVWLRRAAKPTPEFSPTTASAMVGALFSVMPIFVLLFSTGVDLLAPRQLFFRTLSAVILSAPILFLLAPVFILYVRNVVRGKRFLPNYFLCAVAAVSLALEYLLVYYVLSG